VKKEGLVYIGDGVGEVPISLDDSKPDGWAAWTRALKSMLIDLKALEAWAAETPPTM